MYELNFDLLKRFNYLNYPKYYGVEDKIWQIKEINFDRKTVNLSDGRYNLTTSFDNMKPIPLSVDWLKKANYKQLRKVEKTYSLSNFEDKSAIYFSGVRFIHILTGTQLDYVHELQNLHSAIYKEELKFI